MLIHQLKLIPQKLQISCNLNKSRIFAEYIEILTAYGGNGLERHGKWENPVTVML